jgi:hypothetical protein
MLKGILPVTEGNKGLKPRRFTARMHLGGV